MKFTGIRRIFAVLIGLVLMAGGLLKINDPVGTGLIVREYLNFLHLGFLRGMATVIGVFFALLEAGTGAALLTGVWRKGTAIVTSVLVGFFTLLTLILWIFNPEMDCGCFGEAIHLTHLQSLLKNIVLVALAAVAFIPFRNLGEARPRKWVSFCIIAASLVAGLWFSLAHLPSLDFTPFAPNNELYASQDNDYQATDGYEAYYIYQKGSQTGSFSLGHIPDSTWTFVGVDTLLRSTFPMREDVAMLSFSDADGIYQDELAVLGKVVVVSVYRPERLSERRIRRIGQFVADAEANGVTPLILLAGKPDILTGSGLEDKAYTADYKTLITLNRSNGGAVYLDDGSIVRKWSYGDLPSAKALGKTVWRDPLDSTVKYLTAGRLKAQGYVLYLIALLLFI